MTKPDVSNLSDACHLHNVHICDDYSVQARLQTATVQCRSNGVRFTTLRRQVYQLILESDKPLGAYDLIAHLQQTRQKERDDKGQEASKCSKSVAPPTVYRTLEFLLSQGFIHQLTSINAFVPCCHPRDQHAAAFLICQNCQRVQECSSLPVQEVLGFAREDMGFMVSHSVMELSGLCDQCQCISMLEESPLDKPQLPENLVNSQDVQKKQDS